MLHGIEVANTREYYPEAHQWCIEKNLTMISNSDIHNPVNLDYQVHEGDHRPMTLVFARAKNISAVREALFARRTAVYYGNQLIGEERFLRAIFEESTQLINPRFEIVGDGSALLQISNSSDLDYELQGGQQFAEIVVPESLVIQAKKTVLLPVRAKLENQTGSKRFALPYTVKNLLIAPETGMPIELNVEVSFISEQGGD
jgi:hypothetical protein